MPGTRTRKLGFHLDAHDNVCAGIEAKAPVWSMFKESPPAELGKVLTHMEESIEDLNSEIIWTLTET